MELKNLLDNISLLWPDKSMNGNHINRKLYDYTAADVDLDYLTSDFSPYEKYKGFIKSMLASVNENEEIINYRLEILEDFVNNPELISGFGNLLPMISKISVSGNYNYTDTVPLLDTVKRLGELELYVKCVKLLKTLLVDGNYKIHSEGLCRLKNLIEIIMADKIFKSLEENLPKMRPGLERIASVTIGVNLDSELRPVEATIVSVNDQKFKGEVLLNHLFGKNNKDEYQGISELHSIIPKMTINTQTHNIEYKITGDSAALQITLFNDLHKMLSHVVKPIAHKLRVYVKLNGSFLACLENEIAFYIGAFNLINKMRSCGMEMCKPEITSKEDRFCQINGIYNINLALRTINREGNTNINSQIVTNDISFDEHGRLFILTGPNQGGKTTYIQGIALAHILFQAGVFVPGSRARMSPVDGIYTHFSTEEKSDTNTGRLGEESKRLKDIFNGITRHSLLLMNESFSSTSPVEGLSISKEVLYTLKILGARVIFATHLHELAFDLKYLNNINIGDSKAVSLVSSITTCSENDINKNEFTKRSYKIVSGQPHHTSYAKDIASKYGISFEKLISSLQERNLVDLGLNVYEICTL